MRNFYVLMAISGLLVTSLLSSCTIEKRVHNKGYHVEWRGFRKSKAPKKQQDEIANLAIENEEELTEVHYLDPLEERAEDKADVREFVEATDVTETIEDTTPDVDAFIQPQSKRQSKRATTTASPRNVQKRKARTVQKASSSSKSTEGQGAIVAGWVFVIIGFLLLLFVSIAIGLILVILGLIFIGVGFGKKNSAAERAAREKRQQEKEQNKDLEDVVYLKNGTIIRGTIIEQIPNESLKIKTAGGSVFVYTFDEIKKITKEEKTN